jgi:hypothetical protein
MTACLSYFFGFLSKTIGVTVTIPVLPAPENPISHRTFFLV